MISNNRPLTRSEMLVNANHIVGVLTGKGWSKNAVAGMLGNMETESTINPGRWQSGIVHPAQGYGLVQWTPSTNYTSWAEARGDDIGDINSQLDRIEYEVNNGLQWISSNAYPMSFREFKTSTQSPEVLAQAFLINYERPENQNQPARSTQARYWYNTTTGETSGDGSGSQLAVLPIDYVDISQGEYGSFTHYRGSGQELAIDFVFPSPRHPLLAPFDIEVMDRRDSYATVVWKNTRPVMGADGTLHDELHIIVIHDDNWRDYSVGDTRSKGEHFGNSGNSTGGSGISTGDHFHFEVIKGHTYQFPPSSDNQLHIYDVFDTKHVTTWRRDGGYDWKESDFVDGGGGDGGSTESSENNVIAMLLCGAMAGW